MLRRMQLGEREKGRNHLLAVWVTHSMNGEFLKTAAIYNFGDAEKGGMGGSGI